MRPQPTVGDYAGLIAFAAFWAVCGYALYRGIRNGRLWSRAGLVKRSDAPSVFWTTAIVYAAPYAFVAVALAIALVRAVSGMPP